jgi:hypothetical protein
MTVIAMEICTQMNTAFALVKIVNVNPKQKIEVMRMK